MYVPGYMAMEQYTSRYKKKHLHVLHIGPTCTIHPENDMKLGSDSIYN